MIKYFIPIIAICIVCGLATFIGSEAFAADANCRDAKGSVLAMHSRTLCRSVTHKANREHPRWTGVHVECKFSTSSKSSCAWSYTFRGGRCSGDATVSGIAHPRVVYGKSSCVA